MQGAQGQSGGGITSPRPGSGAPHWSWCPMQTTSCADIGSGGTVYRACVYFLSPFQSKQCPEKVRKKRDFKDFKNKGLSAAKINWSLTKDLAKPIGS